MRTGSGRTRVALSAIVALAFAAGPAPAAQRPYGIGTPATPAEIKAWDISITSDGAGLPPGSGTVAQGEQIYAARCAVCHGVSGEGRSAPALAGGRGTLRSPHPILTVGSYWPYATTVFDYVRRAMPFDAPGSLTNSEVYAVTAYVLSLNRIVGPAIVLDAGSLPKVAMPNRAGFLLHDPRPDVP